MMYEITINKSQNAMNMTVYVTLTVLNDPVIDIHIHQATANCIGETDVRLIIQSCYD